MARRKKKSKMSTTKSSQKTLFILSSLTVVCLILAFVYISCEERKFGTTKKFFNLVNPPKDTQESIPYAETNISAPRVLCNSNYDFNVLPPLKPVATSIPLLDNSTVQVTSTLSATLKINNSGEMEYFLNNLKVWKSSDPRSHIGSIEVNVLKEYIGKNNSYDWQSISETSNGLRLHVAPLAITCDKGKRIIWTFLTGWDASAFMYKTSAPNTNECQLPMQVNGKEQANIVLISNNRIKRLLFCPNGDIFILNRAAKEKGSLILITTVQESLIVKYCSSSN